MIIGKNKWKWNLTYFDFVIIIKDRKKLIGRNGKFYTGTVELEAYLRALSEELKVMENN